MVAIVDGRYIEHAKLSPYISITASEDQKIRGCNQVAQVLHSFVVFLFSLSKEGTWKRINFPFKTEHVLVGQATQETPILPKSRNAPNSIQIIKQLLHSLQRLKI